MDDTPPGASTRAVHLIQQPIARVKVIAVEPDCMVQGRQHPQFTGATMSPSQPDDFGGRGNTSQSANAKRAPSNTYKCISDMYARIHFWNGASYLGIDRAFIQYAYRTTPPSLSL